MTPRGRGPALALLAAAVAGLHLWLLHGLPVPPPSPVNAQPPGLRLRTLGAAPDVVASPRPPEQEAAPPARARMASAPPTAPGPSAPAARLVAAQPPATAATANAASGFTTVADRPSPPVRPAALTLPPPLRLHYELRAHSMGLELPGTAELLWRPDGQDYSLELSLHAPPLPARSQRSVGRITAQGLAPDRFSERRRSEQATHFDRAHGTIVFSNNRPGAELPPDAQDRLSVLLQLGAMLAARPPQDGERRRIVLPVAGTGEIQPWEFELQGQERLQLPGGELAAWRLVRLAREEHDQTVELWIAPGLDYAPVRLRLTQPNGDWLDQQWSATDRP